MPGGNLQSSNFRFEATIRAVNFCDTRVSLAALSWSND